MLDLIGFDCFVQILKRLSKLLKIHCCCICLEFPDLKQLLSSERLLFSY